MNIKRKDGTNVSKELMLQIIHRILEQIQTVKSDEELEMIAQEMETWVIVP